MKSAIHRAAFVLLFASSVWTRAEELPAVLAEGSPILTESNRWHLTVQSNGAAVTTYDRPAISARPIVQCRITALATNLWRTSCDMAFTNEFVRGDVVLVTGRARTLETTNTTGRGVLRSIFRLNEKPYDKNFIVRFEVGKEWQRFYFPSTLNFDIPANKGVIQFNLGYAIQLVELCDVQVYRFPPGFDTNRLPKSEATPSRM